MEPEKQLPSTLNKQLKNDDEIHIFSSWTEKIHEDSLGSALAVERNSIYDKQRAAFVNTLGAKDFALKAALAEYIRYQGKDKFWTTFDIEMVTWEDVTDELEKVEAIYQDQGVRNPLRRAVRHGSEHYRIAATFLEAMPDEDGLGILKGALLVVLKATEKRSQVRERIFQCFREVPNILCEANRRRRHFPKDRNLFRLVNALYQTIFDCIPPLIQILLRGPGSDWYKRAGKAVVSALGNQVAEVEGILQPLTAAQRSLQQAYLGLVEERNADDCRVANATQIGIGVLRRNHLQRHYETRSQINTLESKVDSVNSKVDTIMEQVERMESECMASLKENPVTNYLYMLIAGLLRDRQIYDARQKNLTSGRPSGSDWEEQELDVDDVLTMLFNDDEAMSHSRDLCSTLGKHNYFDDRALAQPAYLVNIDRFRKWLVEPCSDILLVDAHVGSEMSGATSSMSVFCATLIKSLLERSRLTKEPGGYDFVLFFFCGLHRNRRSDLEGPSGLIRSILGQLLLAWPRERPPHVKSVPELSGMKAKNTESAIRATARTFQDLISTLPPGTTIYCIVDGIAELDTELWGRSACLKVVVDCLQELVRTSSTPSKHEACLKIVMTSPNSSSKMIRDMFSEGQKIALRAGQYFSPPVSPSSPASLTDQLQRACSLTDTMVQEEPLDRPAHPRGRVSSET